MDADKSIVSGEAEGDVLEMVDVEYIRKLHKVKKWSIRKIVRELGYSRNTVSKYLEAEDPTPRYRLQAPRPRPVLGPVEAVIRRWLEEDEQRPPKQRHTAHRIYERLREEYGFTGSESSENKLHIEKLFIFGRKKPKLLEV